MARKGGSKRSLEETVAIADRLLRLVEDKAPAGVTSYHRNEQLLGATFGRAYRCFRSIRDLAAIYAEADDALVLTRALVVITLRSLWLIKPEDVDERDARSDRVTLAFLRQALKQARELDALGFDLDVDSKDLQTRVHESEAKGVPAMPSELDMARELGLDVLYSRIYRSGSDVGHYSVMSALQGFDQTAWDGETLDGVPIRFREGVPDEAEQVLVMAMVSYVSFLEGCEAVIQHGAAEEAKRLLLEYMLTQDAGYTPGA
jgi:hypothetical protein